MSGPVSNRAPVPSADPPGPWLTLAEASARLRFKSRFGIYKWVEANHIIRVRRGKVWLVSKADVDAALTGMPARLVVVRKRA